MNRLMYSRGSYRRNYRIRILLGTLIALVISDGLISKFLVKHGFAYEGNPLLQRWIGEDAFLVIKAAGAFLAALMLWDIYKRQPKLSFVSTLFFVILYTLIVFWSVFIYLAA